MQIKLNTYKTTDIHSELSEHARISEQSKLSIVFPKAMEHQQNSNNV